MADDTEPTAAAVARVAERLVGRPAGGWVTVLDSGTSVVLRGGGMIVKRPRRGGDSFAAEVAGLRIAAPSVNGLVPEVIAVAAEERVVVMSDLGTGDSVATLLLGNDPEAAAKAVASQAVALAELHNATVDRPPLERRRAVWLAERERTARTAIEAAGLATAPSVLAEFGELADRLLGERGPRVLSPGDVCPDNNVLVEGRVRLFDFEGCGDMHPAMDVAYLAVPFPTCWCSFDLPEEVKDAALGAYLDVASRPDGAKEVDLAIAYFATVSTGLMQAGAPSNDPPPDVGWVSDDGRAMPSPAQRLVQRLRLATASDVVADEFSELHSWLCRQLARCETTWPGLAPLPHAPAFR